MIISWVPTMPSCPSIQNTFEYAKIEINTCNEIGFKKRGNADEENVGIKVWKRLKAEKIKKNVETKKVSRNVNAMT